MVTFACTRCGRCCRSLGRHIRIERQISSRDAYCLDAVHREHWYARTSDCAGGALPPVGEDATATVCPFLRVEPDGVTYRCATYPTRPRVCREFRCFIAIILDTHGHEAGRVKGRRDLVTGIGTLAEAWERVRDEAGSSEETAFRLAAARRLAEAGFSIAWVD